MPSPIIQVQSLTRSIDTGTHRVDILRGIDFEIPAGEFVAIMGASGSGKSTLLGLLAGLDSPTSGNIILDGVNITNLEEDEMAKVRGQKLGFVFQSYQLIPTLTAEENVLLPAELTGNLVSKTAQNGPPASVAGANGGSPGRSFALNGGITRARDLLIRVGLKDRLDHYPVQLSGGEQQRVALARAFMVKPPILMADEPTGNLDSANGQQVLDLLISLNREERTTLVLVTHDRELATHADRVITLKDGLVISDVRKN